MREHARNESVAEAERMERTADDEREHPARFAGGRAPEVGGAFADPAGTAQLAYEDDANARELKQKVGKLVADRFGGNYRAAFDHYDTSKDGKVGKSELVALLADAGVGNGLTRGVWASTIIERLDASGDAAIEWREFESVFRASA